MAITQAYTLDDVTISTSEISIVSGTTTLQNNTTAGVYQLFIDAKNTSDPIVKGDELIVRIYEKVVGTGNKDVFDSFTLSDAQSTLSVSPFYTLMNGWDITIQRTAGTDVKVDASIRMVS